MSLITPDFGLIFWMTLIFGLVFFLLAKFGFPVITSRVAKRRERMDEGIRMADEAEKRLAELEKKQAELLEEARKEQGRIIREAGKARDEIVSQARRQATEEAARIIESAKVQLAAEKESVLRDIRSQVALLSVKVAEKVVRKDLEGAGSQEAFVEKMVDELSETDFS